MLDHNAPLVHTVTAPLQEGLDLYYKTSSNVSQCSLLSSDLLRRHILKYHPEEKPPPSRAQKACRGCHARKERCDGEDPCNRCRRRGTPCLRLHQQKNTSDKQIEVPTANPDPLGEVFRDDSVSDTSWSFLQKYIDIYFENFHPIWPILPRGTFNAPDEPCVLLQSMLMIGLWIKGGQEAQDKAITFHRRLLSTIQAQKVCTILSQEAECV